MGVVSYIRYGKFVLVSSVLLITGKLWFDPTRVNPMIRGEDMAECRSSTIEHQAAYLRDNQVLSFDGSTSTNITSVTNYFSTVQTEFAGIDEGTIIKRTSTNLLTFTQSDYSDWKYFTYSLSGGAFGDPTNRYRLIVNGAIYGTYEIVAAPSGSAYVYAGSNTYADLVWEPAGQVGLIPSSVSVGVRLTQPPDEFILNILSTTNFTYGFGYDRIVDSHILWSQYWDCAKRLRNMVRGNPETFKTGPSWLRTSKPILWLDNVSNFDTALSYGLYSSWVFKYGQRTTTNIHSSGMGMYSYPQTEILVEYFATNAVGVPIFITTDCVMSNNAITATNTFQVQPAGDYDVISDYGGYDTNRLGEIAFIPSVEIFFVYPPPFYVLETNGYQLGTFYLDYDKALTSFLLWNYQGTWWTANKMQYKNDVWRFSFEGIVPMSVTTNIVPSLEPFHEAITTYETNSPFPFFNRTLETNKLNVIKTMASKLNTTFAEGFISTIMNPSTNIETRTRIIRHKYALANTNEPTATYQISDVLDQYDSNVLYQETTNAFSQSIWDNQPLAAISFEDYSMNYHYQETLIITFTDPDLQFSYGLNTFDEGDVFDTDFFPQILSEGSVVENIILDYPSIYAITNGLISRVRIYAIFDFDQPEIFRPYKDFYTNTESVTSVNYTESGGGYSVTYTGTNTVDVLEERISVPDPTRPNYFWENQLDIQTPLTVPIVLNSRNVIDGFTVDSSRYDFGDLFLSESIRVNLMLDVSNPTTVTNLMFSFGKLDVMPDKTFWQTHGLDRTYTEQEVEKGDAYSTFYGKSSEYEITRIYSIIDSPYREYRTKHTIRYPRFFVVVDWKFQHLQTIPFVPDNFNDPQWTHPQPNDDWKTNYYRFDSTGNVMRP